MWYISPNHVNIKLQNVLKYSLVMKEYNSFLRYAKLNVDDRNEL